MKRFFLLSITILILFGCQQTTETGFVGQQFLLKADVPNEVGPFDYIWKITDLPEASEMVLSDIQFSEDESQAIFIPDVVGHYSLQVTVWKYNDKLGAISYNYDIVKMVEEISAEQESRDEWLNKSVEDVQEITEEITSNPPTEEITTDSIDKQPETPEVATTIVDKVVEEIKATPSSQQQTTDDGIYTIQIAAESKLESATGLVKRFKEAGFDAYIQEYSTSSYQIVYRVRVGKYLSREEASQIAKTIENEYGLSTWITKYQ